MAELILEFYPDGTIKKETAGFEGKECVEATNFIERVLEAYDKRIEYKPEYYKNKFRQREDRLKDEY